MSNETKIPAERMKAAEAIADCFEFAVLRRATIGDEASRRHLSEQKAALVLALASAPAATHAAAEEPAKWRPIETAPKDGREVLLWLGAPWSRVEKARFYSPWDNWQCGAIMPDPAREELSGIGSSVPTHWMPLPSPPDTMLTGLTEAETSESAPVAPLEGVDLWIAQKMLVEAAKTGHEGTMRLAAQLAGAAPCEKCDFVKQHCRCPAASVAPAPASVAWNDAKQAELNDWFLSLPEGRRAALIADKWMLAAAAFDAGKSSSAAAVQAEPAELSPDVDAALTYLNERITEHQGGTELEREYAAGLSDAFNKLYPFLAATQPQATEREALSEERIDRVFSAFAGDNGNGVEYLKCYREGFRHIACALFEAAGINTKG